VKDSYAAIADIIDMKSGAPGEAREKLKLQYITSRCVHSSLIGERKRKHLLPSL
jgi:hypothetical protein